MIDWTPSNFKKKKTLWLFLKAPDRGNPTKIVLKNFPIVWGY